LFLYFIHFASFLVASSLLLFGFGLLLLLLIMMSGPQKMLSLMHFQILLLSCLFLKLQCVWAVLRSRLVLNCGDQFWVEKSLVLFSGKIESPAKDSDIKYKFNFLSAITGFSFAFIVYHLRNPKFYV